MQIVRGHRRVDELDVCRVPLAPQNRFVTCSRRDKVNGEASFICYRFTKDGLYVLCLLRVGTRVVSIVFCFFFLYIATFVALEVIIQYHSHTRGFCEFFYFFAILNKPVTANITFYFVKIHDPHGIGKENQLRTGKTVGKS